MNKLNLLFVLLATVLISACEDDPEEKLQASIDTNNASDFDPSNSIIPFPNDLLFSGTLDGTINIPVDDPTDLADPQVAINALDGFSTVAPFTAGFLGAIDATSITPSTVRVFEVTRAPTNLNTMSGGDIPALSVGTIVGELAFGVDFVATLSTVDTTNSTLVVVPLKPLKPKTSYQIVVTNGLMSAQGNPMLPSATYSITKRLTQIYDVLGTSGLTATDPAFTRFSDEDLIDLEVLREIISESEATVTAAAAPAITVPEIILSWHFTTQSTSDVLTAARSLVAGAPTTVLAPAGTTLGGAGNLYSGTIEVPYYLTASTGVNDPTALGSVWKAASAAPSPPFPAGDTEFNLTWFNPVPAPTDATLTIPMLVSTPMAGAPWPVVIFQHGITSDRTAMLGIADALSLAGFAVVAIDLPMHGLDSTNALYSAGNERTFDLDLVTQDPATGGVTASVPDGVTDSSGRHFINLTNLLNTRDNLRQAVADLFTVTTAIATIDVDGGGADLVSADIYFAGHSLGAIVGTTFLGIETGIKASVLANPGTYLAKVIDGSASIGPEISAGLAANGIIKGTADFESFVGAVQTVIDSADPVNYAATQAASRGILLFEIVGGNSSPSDLVVPITVPDANDSTGTVAAPLAGTEAQITIMGLTHINATPSVGVDLQLVTKYTSGDHSSFLDPTADAAVTAEMQSETASFLTNNGTTVTVTDDTVLLAP